MTISSVQLIRKGNPGPGSGMKVQVRVTRVGLSPAPEGSYKTICRSRD